MILTGLHSCNVQDGEDACHDGEESGTDSDHGGICRGILFKFVEVSAPQSDGDDGCQTSNESEDDEADLDDLVSSHFIEEHGAQAEDDGYQEAEESDDRTGLH